MTKIRISCDDACSSDMRLADLCTEYGVECTFYWPVEWHSLAYDKGYEPLSFAEAQEIASQFEIGAHTITHRHLTRIPLADALYEISASKRMLERLFHKSVTKFAPPRGYTGEFLTEYILKGYESMRLTRGENLVHIHHDSGANDNKPWRDCITDKTEELFCHSHELDKFNLWGELEEYLRENSSS